MKGNRKQGLEKNLSDVREVIPKIYETEGERDPIKIYEIYSIRRPNNFSNADDPLYLALRNIPLEDSNTNIWFLRQTVGERKLCSLIKKWRKVAYETLINGQPTIVPENIFFRSCEKTMYRGQMLCKYQVINVWHPLVITQQWVRKDTRRYQTSSATLKLLEMLWYHVQLSATSISTLYSQ